MTSSMMQDDPDSKREELKSNWKIASAAQFLSAGRIGFKLPQIEIEEIEEGLLDENSVGRKYLLELIVALLKGINNKVKQDNWEFHLQKLVKKYFVPDEGKNHPFPDTDKSKTTNGFSNSDDTEDLQENSLDKLTETDSVTENNTTSFWNLDASFQADIILFLCYMRADKNDSAEAMKDVDAESLRALPLGYDNDDNKYWYFYGTRLYKEEPIPEEKAKDWENECTESVTEVQKERGRGRPRKGPKKPRIIEVKNENIDGVSPKRGRGRPRKALSEPKKSESENEPDDVVDDKKSKVMDIAENSRWSVVCNTLEDWMEFAEKFRNSKSKCEKALFEVIQLNFLPDLPEIYQEKEKRLKQKMKEIIASQPRPKMELRARNRSFRHLQDFYVYEDDVVDNKESKKMDRASRLEERNRRANAKPRSNRRRFRFEDYYNNDEESFETEMPQEEESSSMESPDPEYEDKYVQEYHPLYYNGVDMMSAVIKLIGEIKVSKDAWPFVEPVNKEEVPDYYEIIVKPIDLSTMMQKLLDGAYGHISDLDADFKLLVSNCKLYNGENDYTRMAHKLYQSFLNGMMKLFESTKHSNVSPKKIIVQGDGRKRKREVISSQDMSSVKKSNNSPQHVLFSDEPVYNNSEEVVEGYMSDSSNQDNDNSNGALSSMDEDSSQDSDNDCASQSNGYIDGHVDNEENSNEPLLNGDDNLSNECSREENDFSEQESRESSCSLPADSQGSNRQHTNSLFSDVSDGSNNQIDEKNSNFGNMPVQLNKTAASPPTQVPNSAVFANQQSPPTRAPHDKLYPHQNHVKIIKPELNKFSPATVSRPPSSGKIIFVPDKNDQNKMTFHLRAQPHSSQSQTGVGLKANSSPELAVNQIMESSGKRTIGSNLHSVPQQEIVPRYSTASSSMKVVCQPQMIQPVITHANYSTSSNSSSVAANATNYIRVNSNATTSSTPTMVFKTIRQQLQQTQSNLISSRHIAITPAQNLNIAANKIKRPATIRQQLNGCNEPIYYVQNNTVMQMVNGNQQNVRLETPVTQSIQNVVKASTVCTPTYQNLQNFGISTSSINPVIYTQVNTGQFINVPSSYMITNQNVFQQSVSPSVMNIQPLQVGNRPMIINLGSR